MNPRERAILLRYHEVALKGDNRRWFEDRLMINARKMLQRALGKDASIEVTRKHGRVLVDADWNETSREALNRVFGIVSFSPMRKVPTSIEAIQRAALDEFESHVRAHGMPQRFRVATRRSDKALPQPSMELDREFGSPIKEAHPGLVVELKNPELVVGIEVRFGESYVWTEKTAGPGGLPVGTNGRVLSLLSGGLDSPVAAIQLLRRGSPVSYLHFYGAPFVGEDVLEKVEDLVRIVNRYQADPQPLHVVPFGKLQEKIALATNPKLRTVLYRRMMVRVACELAAKQEIRAIATGESLGQVASQTLENLSVIDSVAAIPILRPLITYDKDEIIAQAKKWGTYETAIRPGVDCCTLFADRHPAIRAEPSQIEEQETRFPMQDLVKEAVESIELRRVY